MHVKAWKRVLSVTTDVFPIHLYLWYGDGGILQIFPVFHSWPRTKKTQRKSPEFVRHSKRTRTRSQSAYTVGLSQNNYIDENPTHRSVIVYSCTSVRRQFLQLLIASSSVSLTESPQNPYWRKYKSLGLWRTQPWIALVWIFMMLRLFCHVLVGLCIHGWFWLDPWMGPLLQRTV